MSKKVKFIKDFKVDIHGREKIIPKNKEILLGDDLALKAIREGYAVDTNGQMDAIHVIEEALLGRVKKQKTINKDGKDKRN